MKKSFLNKYIILSIILLMILNGCGKNNSACVASSSTITSAVSAVSSSLQPVTAVTENPRVKDNFFDDAVFIGDSVSLKLKNYVTQKRKSQTDFLGKAKFLTAGSMGSGNALQNVSSQSIHPLVNGKKMSLPEGVSVLGAKKVYIMLGMNDIVIYGIDGSVDNMAKLIGQIKEKNSNVVFYIQSTTPILKDKQKKTLNNPNLIEYNKRLAEKCKEQKWDFIDVASVMRDADGNLKSDYCSDPNDGGMHFTDKACQVWVDYLYTHTAK